MSKTRMGKRVASLLLSLVMMLSLLPTTVYATEGADTGDITDEIVGQANTSVANTEGTGKLESTGEGEDDSEAGNKAETSVAQVDGTQYATLEAAIGAATDGATVSLLGNVTLNTTLTVEGKTITIDVGGFTLTVATTDGDGIAVKNATLTLTGAGKYVFNCTAGGSDGIFVNGTSTLNLNGDVEINVNSAVNSAIHAYGEAGSAVVNINNGTIKTNGTSKFSAVIIDQNATLNMNGGTFDLSVDFDTYSDGNDVVGVLIWGEKGAQKNCAVNISGGRFEIGGRNAFAQAVQVGMKNGESENCTVNISGGEVVLNPTESGKGYVFASWSEGYATASIIGGTVSGAVTALTVTSSDKENTSDLTISGGTFSTTAGTTLNVEKYLAEGRTLDESGNVVDKAPEVKPVTVNGVGYDTLEAAIAAAQDGDTVTLLADVGENVEIAAGKNLTLDLNDCTLNGGTGTNKAALTNYGTITITDSSEAKTGTIKRDDIGTVGETSYYVILNQGTMTIESGNVINNSGYKKANSTGSMVGSSLICNGDCNGGSTLTINGGTFTQYNFIAIKNGALGVLNVTGGMITSNHSAIQNWFEADITGGEINGQLWTDAYTAGGSNGKTKIGGNATFTGEIVMDIYGNSVAPKLEITGGKLNVTNWRITGAAAAVGAKPAVSGGTFTAEVPADYLADGFEIKQNSDGSYGVEKAASYVAKIDEQSYATLQAAFDAANAGATVTLLADTTEDVTIDKNITLDLGGKTLTNAGAGKATLTIAKGATATVKNGSVVGGTSYYTIQNNGTATLEDVTATAGNTGSSMIDNYGTLTIKSGTYEGGLNVVKSEEGSTLTINGGKFTLEYATEGYTGVVFAYGNTTITGGEFIQNLTTTGRWNHPTVILTGVVEGYTAITRVTGGHFVNKMSGESIFRGAGKGTSDNFEVSGGTFNKSVPDSFFKEGYFAQKNTDGTYGVGGPAVAKVNSAEGYNTLAEAIAAAKAGETVTLLQNVTVDKPIIVGKAITLDLGGKTLTSTWAMPSDASGADRYALVNNAKMTLTNGTFAAGEARAIGAYAGLTLNNVTVSQTLTGGHACVAFCKDGATYTIKDSTINGAYAVANFANNATIKITGSELNGSGCGLYHNGSNYGLELTVRATTINGSLDGAIGNENDPSGVYISGSTATVEKGGMQFASFTNCTIKGATAIEVKYTNLKLDKCTVEATAKTPSYSKNNNGMTALGFAVVSTDNSKDGVTPVPAGTVTITGKGNYTGLVGLGALKSVKETYKDFADGTIKVSGGTFDSAVMPEYCADGFVPTQNDNGTYGVREANYVAQIGSTKYESLAEAIDKAGTGDTVTLLANLDLSATGLIIAKNKDVTLDLNGKTLKLANTDSGNIMVEGKLTLKDSTDTEKNGTGTGKVWTETPYIYGSQDKVLIAAIDGGTFTMESGLIDAASFTTDNTNKGQFAVSVQNENADASVIINGGCIKAGWYAIAGNGQDTTYNGNITVNGGILESTADYAIYHPHSGTTTINGGVVFGAAGGISLNRGKLIVNGGTITSKGTGTTGDWGDGTGSQDAAAINVNAGYGSTSVEIKGGKITAEKNAILLTNGKDGTISVSGGTFSSAVKEEYCATGYIPTANADGTYGVKEGKYVAYVGTSSTNKFETLQEAINAAKSNQTVNLLADITLTERVVVNNPARSITLNLRGHSITARGNALLNNGNLTIMSTGDASKTGKIESETGYAVGVGSGSKLTISSGTLKGREGAVITGTSTGATIDIKKDATLIATDNAVIAGNGSAREGDPNTITIKGGTLTGGIESEGYIACGIYTPWKDNVTVSGGTFNITNGAGIVARAGTVKVTGGTFNCTGDGTGWVGDNKNQIPCAALVFDKAANYPALTDSSQILVSGGSFSTDPAVNGATLAAGYVATQTDGVYKVAKANPVAAIGDVKYDTLSQAIAALEGTGGTIKLLQDINAPSMNYKITENITIDLNGHNITGSGAEGVFYVYTSGHLTITGDGVITAVENNKAAIAVQVYSENAKVTLEGGTYKQQITNTNDPHFDLIYVYYGTAEIKGGTYEGATPNWTLNCKDENYKAKEANIEVTGGTFKGFDPANNKAEGEGTSFVPTGYVPKANGDGSYTVVKGTYVAEYNGTKYTSLQEAINAASQKNGGQAVVTLLGNLTITETVNFAKQYGGSVLLNLGGYTLTGENCRALQINKGNLYLENGTVTSTGIADSKSVIRIGSDDTTYSGSNPMLYMRNGAKVLAPVSYGVTIFGSATVSETLTVAGNASIEATGPSPAISGQGGQAYHVDGKGTKVIITGNAVVSATNNYAIYHPDNGTLDIQGGTITGKGGIQMCSGTLTISGSPKIEALGKADHETGAAGPIYDIAAISVVNRSYPGGAPVVTIKGTPTVTANEGEVIHAYTWSSNAESEWADAGKNINVSGGTYSKTFNEAYLAAGCTLVDGENGTYTVEQKPVAEYNGTQYTSLPQAILDANNSEAGGTVKLLDNVTLTRGLGIGGSAPVTLDLDKKTLTLNGAQIYTQGSATVTINNGTIKRTDEPTSGSPNDFAIQVMSGSSLTLGATSADTVTIESTYGVYNAGGTLTVSHATITTDGWSIAVNDSASKTGVVTIGEGAVITSRTGNCISTRVNSKPNVTITGGQLTSNGTNWDAGVIYWASEGTLTITGGTFTASSAEGSTAAAVHQKNGTVKISGTTAELQGNKALVVQAGDGSTGTMVTELSGGTYSTKPEEAWVVNGYRAIDNTDGSYTVKAANIAIQVTSRIQDDGDTTVSTTTGGGMYCEGEKVTVTTSNVIGFEFLGWYEKVNGKYGEVLSADLSYTFTASKSCTLVALYSPVENATLTVKVTASAFRITGSKWEQNNGGMYKLPVGSSVTVTYTDDTYAFLYWVNGSDKIVSTNSEYTFTLGSNTELRACTSPRNTEPTNAMVVFKTAYDQVLTAQRYDVAEEIVFPMGPSKTGYKFIGWSMTQAEIRAAMAANDYIVVTPKYETLGKTYTVTVVYDGITRDKVTYKDLNAGDSILLTAEKTVDGKTFSCWKIGDEVVSYLTTLTVFDTEDVTVTAVYSDKAPETKATIRITDTAAVMNGQKYQLVFTQAYALPENATLISTGFIRATDESAAADLTLEHFAYQYVSKLTTNEGAYELRLNRTSSSEVIYVRAYVQYTDADGKLQTSYSDVVHASYDILTKGGNN